MRNLRKLTAVVIALALVLTSMTAAFAATDSTAVNGEKAIVLNELGLYAGISSTEFNPDLDANLTREQGTVILLKMFGLTDEAEALTDAEVAAALEGYTDADKVSSWAKKAIAYAVSNDIMSGTSTTTVGSAAKITGAQFATLLVKTMGYTVADWKLAVTQLSEIKGSKVADEFADENLTRDAAVGYMYGTLTAETADKTTIIANLIAENPEIAEIAKTAGLLPAVASKALDVDTVTAINSKLVEVSLSTAATAADATASTFAVKDSAGKAYTVVSSVIAPWSDKAVLVTLEADTTAGTLYTLTTGAKSFNFGGRAKDTGKPAVSKVEATDANEVIITFDEAIKLETLKVAIAESYGTKAVLAVNSMKYDGADKVILSVGDMKASTLYKYTITDVTDLAGNQLDSNKAESTFVGFAKPTDALKFASADKAKANYCDEVAVQFNVNVDPASLVPANFTITEKYGTKAAVAVTAVRIAKKDDKSTAVSDIASDSDGRKYAILTVDATMKDATLYEVKFTGLKTLYGVAQSTTDADIATTFVGVKKPSDPVELNSLNIGASSNTSFTISFKQKMDKTLAETIANYTLAEAYGTKAALAITKAELQSNGTDVKFTTAAFNTVLYKLTINNLKDVYGNANKTADSANVVSIAGKAVAAKISKIDSITRPSGTAGDTQIIVDFDGSVGANATDVSLYTIDGGVGYPSKAAKVDGAGNEEKVLLTIGKTTAGTSYKLTVKGLLNADGVVMGTDGASASFAGKGNAYTLPKMQAVLATDKQTIKVYFDRAVDSSDIKGKIWTDAAGTNGIIGTALQYKYTTDTNLRPIPANKAWKDPENANVLIIRTSVADTFKSGTSAQGSQFILDGTGTVLDGDNDTITFANNDADVAKPQITAAMANDKNTVTVYFDQAVSLADVFANNIFTVGINEDPAAANDITVAVNNLAKAVKIDDKTYKIALSGSLTNRTYYIRVATLGNITDKSGFYTLKPTKDGGSYTSMQFGGSTADATGKTITDVSVMMTDKNTLKVYFPERMDATSVKTAANYKIYAAADGTTAAGTISVPTTVVYDADTNTATLYLSGATISGATNNTYYLGITDVVKNEIGLKFIKNDKTISIGSGILVSFAASTADDAKPTIKKVSVDLDLKNTITVEFDETVVTSGAITGLFEIINTTSGSAVVVINSITKTDDAKFVIVVNEDINLNHSYEIKLILDRITNLGGTKPALGTDAQKFVFTATK